jgi:hypothetical protein
MEADKPKVERIEWWEQLLSTIEDRGLPRWTELGLTLCNVAKEDQEAFREAMLELRRMIVSGERPADDYILFTNGPPQRRDYFVGLFATDSGSSQRSKQMTNVAKQAFARDDAIDRLTLIGLSAVQTPDPTPCSRFATGDDPGGPPFRIVQIKIEWASPS